MTDTRVSLEDLEIQRFFFAPSFEVYGGVAGLFDFGPVGCAIERNLMTKWREHFVIEDDMCEVRCSMLTPYKVLESSGHTAKFADFMVTDTVNSRLYRADHLVEQMLGQRIAKNKNPEQIAEMERDQSAAGDMKADELEAVIAKYDVKSPEGNPLSRPVPFNLMFNTYIGPGQSALPGFLRPETAQGIFLNFPRLFEFQRGRLPFACVQQGVSFRNEIAPRNGLIRCREFMMAEIEHFADPAALNDFPKFDSVKDLEILFFSAPVQEANQDPIRMTLAEAVGQGTVCHKTLGYYIGRTYLFLIAIGADPNRVRFRQHREHEKAHYARDCWDAEMKCEAGWIECVGLADRQSFDLTQHGRATARSGEQFNPQMTVQIKLDKPIQEERYTLVPNKAFIGKQFRAQAKDIMAQMQSLRAEEIDAILDKVHEAEALIGGPPPKGKEQATIEQLPDDVKGQFLSLTTVKIAGNDIPYWGYTASKAQVNVHSRTVIPVVIEPSFGIGRIMTIVLEHSYYVRPDGIRRVLRLPAFLAPYKCVVLPLGTKIVPIEHVDNVRKALRQATISHQTDSSGVSIGKRYARSDELGIPYAITLDPVTVQNGTVTLRERDSTSQIRLTVPEAVAAILAISAELDTWQNIASKHEAVVPPADTD